MQAILGPCPDKNLVIRLACIDIEYSHQPSTQSKGMYVGHPNESHISALLAIADVLKNRNIESCTIEAQAPLEPTGETMDIERALQTAQRQKWLKCLDHR